PELSGVPPDTRPLEPTEQQLELDAFVSSWLDRAIDEPGHRAHASCVALLRAHPLGFVRRELRAMVDDRHWSLTPLTSLGAVDMDAPPSPSLDDWRRPEAILAAREAFVRTQWRTYMHYIQAPLAPLVQACALLARPNAKQLQLRERVVTILQRHLPEPRLDTIVDDVQGLVTTKPSAELGPLAGPLQQLRNGHRVLSTRRERSVMPDPQASLDRAHAEHLARWVALASVARADWIERLRARALLRYDDLEHMTWALLDEPRAQGHLRGRYRHILVDEYQDINPMQAQIIDRLAELAGVSGQPAKVFFVGDPKQSIYRFRGAMPEVFRRLQEEIPAEGQLPLSVNFRSQPAVLSFINGLFQPLFGRRYEPLHPSRPQLAPEPAAQFLWAAAPAGASAEAKRRCEARRIAQHIQQLLEDPTERIAEKKDSGWTARRVKRGDIAILFRALSDVQFYEEALRWTETRPPRLVHGDFTPANILVSERGEPYLLDFERVGIGNEDHDFAWFWIHSTRSQEWKRELLLRYWGNRVGSERVRSEWGIRAAIVYLALRRLRFSHLILGDSDPNRAQNVGLLDAALIGSRDLFPV
ncbi:MAG: UvrD-helicase domain-containing protein, partial [Planctomycetes bacterium]|nr:UvrD-helicase domain-containing protein [Planctomycetota bacterium]